MEATKLDIPEYQGESDEIARAKCQLASKLTKGQPVMTEDTSIEFNAFNGLPGPYIKDFAVKIGAVNLPKLLAAFEDKSAKAVSTIGFYDGKDVHLFRGEVNGTIVEARGVENKELKIEDMIFLPKGHDQTFGEMGLNVKKIISHRTLAFRKLCSHLKC